MKLKSIRNIFGGYGTALMITAAMPAALAEVTVDGTRDSSDTGYIEKAVQTTTTNWGAGNAIANLHTVQDGSSLAVFIGGKASDNAIILFIDSKAGGLTAISNNTITSGGEEYTINRLSRPSTTGLEFETGFTPDYAIRIWGNSSGTEAHVNRYDLQAGTRAYVGQTVAANAAASGIVSEVRTLWTDTTTPLEGVVNGVEMKLSLAALGVPNGAAQPVKLMAMLVNGGSSYGSNQVLGSRTSTTDIGGNGGDGTLNPINFETEDGIQTISLTVDNTDTDGDGINNDDDTDDDDDGLLDIHENGGGVYVSPTQTGTNPLIKDTDGDTYPDGDEVNSTLGYPSNPNIPNYNSMAVPGNFTTPQWKEDGSAGNAMTQAGTSLTDQYVWKLDYRFITAGPIAYKFAANGSYTASWGDGGNDINAAIQATGFHTFLFNNASLTRLLVRTTFADPAAYLAAYGLTAGTDADGDGILNESEFTANTDPTAADSDGDGLNDAVDPSPLLASRDIMFSVDMTVQEALGYFKPATGNVVVKFFSGVMSGQPDLALTEVGDTGIYTGTLSGVTGPVGTSFGNYKFFNTTPSAPNSGYEESDNRTFDLGDVNTLQTLDTVYFNNNSSLPKEYSAWAGANAGGQSADLDYDGDGVANGVEYFMGQTGSSFTANPQPVAGVVTWPRDPGATGVTFRVWSSDNLSAWTDVTGSADTSSPNSVKYTLPPGNPRIFIRLEVEVP
jgi:hypothetical protein